MFGLKKKGNRQISYVDAHNTAVIRYKRACKAFIWVGVVNFVGLLVGITQYFTHSVDYLPFFYCFGICDFTFVMLLPVLGESNVGYWFIVIGLSLATTAGAVLLAVFSSMGKKKVLIAMLSAYLVDWVMVFLAYFIAHETTTGLLVNAGIHVIASFFLIMALYQYFNVLNIEKRFKDIPTVAEVKEREQQEQEKENQDGN